MTATVEYEAKDGVATIWLNRADKLNALDDGTATALLAAWDRLEADETVHVAILAARGEHFCAGADVSGAADLAGALPGLQQHRTYTGNGRDRFKPVVGAVQGYALGAGYLLAVRGCDLVVAAEDALFGFPEGQAGIAMPPPEYIPTMPFKLNLEFMLLGWKGGSLIGADRAYEVGMINKVTSRSSLLDEARRYADLLRQVPPLYVRSIKRGLYRALETRTSAVEEDWVRYILPQSVSEDRLEALAARKERRPASYRGR